MTEEMNVDAGKQLDPKSSGKNMEKNAADVESHTGNPSLNLEP